MLHFSQALSRGTCARQLNYPSMTTRQVVELQDDPQHEKLGILAHDETAASTGLPKRKARWRLSAPSRPHSCWHKILSLFE